MRSTSIFDTGICQPFAAYVFSFVLVYSRLFYIGSINSNTGILFDLQYRSLFPSFYGLMVFLFLPLLSQFKFALNEFNQIQPKKFKESVEFDKILKTIDKLSSF